MSMIYLDNAATSFPKPSCVLREVNRCIGHYCGNAGRGSHPLALAAANKIFECREQIATLFHTSSPEQIFFTLNATYALNVMIKGLLRPGDHVLISDLEHNALWRPIERCFRDRLIEYDLFPSMLATKEDRRLRNPVRICARIAARLKPNTRAVFCTHQSNLCSATMPLAEIGAFCRRHHLLFIVDASQSAGHQDIDMEGMKIDALCAPGHKGLYGIQGCGFGILREGLCPDTLVEGGSGYASLEALMPTEFPERGEAGTLPTPAIAGLCEGIKFIRQIGTDEITAHEKRLFAQLYERLQALPAFHVMLPEYSGSTLMFYRKGTSSDKIGAYLASKGICVRTGYHCAALGHRTLGTPDGGGVRISTGVFNRPADIEMLYRTLLDMERGYEIKQEHL